MAEKGGMGQSLNVPGFSGVRRAEGGGGCLGMVVPLGGPLRVLRSSSHGNDRAIDGDNGTIMHQPLCIGMSHLRG